MKVEYDPLTSLRVQEQCASCHHDDRCRREEGHIGFHVGRRIDNYWVNHGDSRIPQKTKLGLWPHPIACRCGVCLEKRETEAKKKEKPSRSHRFFETGAWRGGEAGKYDYEAFFSPLVLERRAQYMHVHRYGGGQERDGDNWQKGIPMESYMKSGWRHFFDWWKLHRHPKRRPTQDYQLEEALCALMFNIEGYLHELLKKKDASLEEK